jgi:S1-C subfamily serine protease
VKLAAAAVAGVLVAGVAALILMADSAGPAVGPAVVDVLVVPAVGSADVATGFEHGEGRVVTVAHLIPGRRARVRVRDGRGTRRARVIALDRSDDLALLAVGGGERSPSPLPARDAPHVLVRRGGHPVAIEASVLRRIRARIRPQPGAAWVRRPALEVEARVRQGDSGAPVVAADGRLLGVLFAQSSRDDETAYAVAAERIQRAR